MIPATIFRNNFSDKKVYKKDLLKIFSNKLVFCLKIFAVTMTARIYRNYNGELKRILLQKVIKRLELYIDKVDI